jgi:hypothetical protein
MKSTNFSQEQKNDPAHSACQLKEDCNCTLTGERLDKFLRNAPCTDHPFGPGTKEVPQFIPMHNELIQLLKYWTKRKIDADYFYFLYGEESEWPLLCLANSRISQLAELLENEAVHIAIDVAYHEFGRTQDARLWDIFVHGTSEDWLQIQKEMRQVEVREIDPGKMKRHEDGAQRRGVNEN